MEPHLKTSRIHHGLSWLFAILTLMLLPLPLSTLMSEENVTLSTLAPRLALPAGTFAIGLLHYFIGRGARNRKRWARVASICIAAVMLLAVPVPGIEEAFDFVSTSANGAILAVLFLGTPQRTDVKAVP